MFPESSKCQLVGGTLFLSENYTFTFTKSKTAIQGEKLNLGARMSFQGCFLNPPTVSWCFIFLSFHLGQFVAKPYNPHEIY